MRWKNKKRSTASRRANVPVYTAVPQTGQTWKSLARAAAKKYQKAVNQVWVAIIIPCLKSLKGKGFHYMWSRRFPRGGASTKFPKLLFFLRAVWFWKLLRTGYVPVCKSLFTLLTTFSFGGPGTGIAHPCLQYHFFVRRYPYNGSGALHHCGFRNVMSVWTLIVKSTRLCFGSHWCIHTSPERWR